MITLVYTLLNAVSSPMPTPDFVGSNFNTWQVLILCPPAIQANWTMEFRKWTGIHHMTANASVYHRATDGPILPPGFDGNAPGMNCHVRLCTLQALRQEARCIVTQVVNFGHMRNIEMRLAALHNQLPCKAKYVISYLLMPAQMCLYHAYLAYIIGIGSNSVNKSILGAASSQNVLVHGSTLLSICNHPAIYHSIITSSINSANAAAMSND
ncbi:hypothetical protein GGI06_000593 [Coemansia sp. S85]|nr:hypothetical protein GGI06_000593 [Coemansia sp. S85]